MNNGQLAIPTFYNGVRFRSRLEARWAAFFDRLAWPWEYEPYDYNRWFPDFVIRGVTRETLVEVKPVRGFPKDIAQEIERSGCTQEVLIVGQAPFTRQILPAWRHDRITTTLGWIAERYEDGSFEWGDAVMGKWVGSESSNMNPSARLGFCHSSGSFVDRITGCYDGGHHGEGDTLPAGVINALWKDACNTVQWNPPRAKPFYRAGRHV